MIKGTKMKQYNVEGLQTRQVIIFFMVFYMFFFYFIGFYAASERFAIQMWNFQTFGIHIWGIIENAAYVHLRLNSLPWHQYC